MFTYHLYFSFISDILDFTLEKIGEISVNENRNGDTLQKYDHKEYPNQNMDKKWKGQEKKEILQFW